MACVPEPKVVRTPVAIGRSVTLAGQARAGNLPPAVTPSPSSQSAVGVLLVDDQAVFRGVARDVVEATPGFAVVGEASSGEEAVEVAQELQPELVLLDVRMPAMDGLETARRVVAAHAGGVIVLISVEDAAELPPGVESCGAATFIRKQDFGPAALSAMWAAHGRRALPSNAPPQ